MSKRFNFMQQIDGVNSGATRQDLANYLGISVSQVNHIFTGHRKFTEEHLVKIRAFLVRKVYNPEEWDFEPLSYVKSTMPQFSDEEKVASLINKDLKPIDVLKAKNWTIRKLSEKTKIPYEELRDFIHGVNVSKDIFLVAGTIFEITEAVGCKATDFNWIDDSQRAWAYNYDLQHTKAPPTKEDWAAYIAYMKKVCPK
jgi:hypothetical protein